MRVVARYFKSSTAPGGRYPRVIGSPGAADVLGAPDPPPSDVPPRVNDAHDGVPDVRRDSRTSVAADLDRLRRSRVGSPPL
jgi:hypothetical protein